MSKNQEGQAPQADATVSTLRDEIEQTRKDMGATLGALETRLNPTTLGDKASTELDHLEARVKSAVKEGIDEAKAAAAITVKEGLDNAKEAVAITLREGVDHAKEAVATTLKEGVAEAKEAVTHGLKEARETVRRDVADAIAQTKHSVRENTLGRVEDLATQAGDIMNDTRDTLADTVRRNPIPAALAGIGIAWLLMNRSSSSRDRSAAPNGGGFNPYRGMDYGPSGGREGGMAVGDALSGAQHAVTDAASKIAHRVGDAAGQVGTMAGNAASQARDAVGHAGQAVMGAAHDAGAATTGALGSGVEAVSHYAHDAQAAAGQLAHRAGDLAGSAAGVARDQAKRVEGGIASAWDANPLVFGAAAIAAGAALGYALPRTAKEDEVMGEMRDRAVHDVAEFATEAIHSLQHVAEDAGKGAKDAATSAVR